MDNNFLSVQSVAAAGAERGFIAKKDEGRFNSLLVSYDIALDGAYDGGLWKNQIPRDAYLTVNNSFASNDSARMEKTNHFIKALFAGREAAASKSQSDPWYVAGAKTLIILPLLPFALLSGCGPEREYHKCKEKHDSSMCHTDECYYDDEGNEKCKVCPDGYVADCNSYGCDCDYQQEYHGKYYLESADGGE